MKGIAAIFSTNVRRFRELRGLTQAALSEQVGISINFLSQIEGGKKFPRDGVVDKFAEALDTPAYELFVDWDVWQMGSGDELAAKTFSKAFIKGLESEAVKYVEGYFKNK